MLRYVLPNCNCNRHSLQHQPRLIKDVYLEEHSSACLGVSMCWPPTLESSQLVMSGTSEHGPMASIPAALTTQLSSSSLCGNCISQWANVLV